MSILPNAPFKRLKAVMATRHMAPREAMEIWSKATRDPIDDVRLLAYAMKDDHEKRLTDRILALTEALPDFRCAMHKMPAIKQLPRYAGNWYITGWCKVGSSIG